MASKETSVTHAVMLKASKLGAVVFKNVRGMFYSPSGSHMVKAGLLADGSSDLIGWHSVTVTPDMVGRRVAVFLAVEVKQGNGRASKEQAHFVAAVKAAGGIAGVVYSDDELESLIKNSGL